MTTTVVLSAFDAKGNWLDITGKTLAELREGACDYVTFDYDDIADVRKILATVQTTRTANLWDWDGEAVDGGFGAVKRARIACFKLYYRGTLMESWITPWGQHCRTSVTGTVTLIAK